MSELFSDFEWAVFPSYQWQEWLDSSGQPVTVGGDEEGQLASLGSAAGVEFAWQEYHEEGQETGPVLGPVLESGPLRKYRPMERKHAVLFRRFAVLDFRDKQEILVFASSYGSLSVVADQQFQDVLLPTGKVHTATGESHLTWAHEICLMREALSLTQRRPEAEQAEIESRYMRYGLDPEHRRKEDARRLDWLFNVHLQHVQPRMSFRDQLPPRLSYAPLTLLAAMWLQLALAIADDKQFQACKFCRDLFEISTAQTGFRSHREFCSDTCKTKDYRRRKRTALSLLGEGQPFSKVAKQLDTPVETIRNWKQAAKSRRKKRSS